MNDFPLISFAYLHSHSKSLSDTRDDLLCLTTPKKPAIELDFDSDGQSTLGSTPFSHESSKYLKIKEMNFDISPLQFQQPNVLLTSDDPDQFELELPESSADLLEGYIAQVETQLQGVNKEQAEMFVQFSNPVGITQTVYKELLTHIFQSLVFVKHLPDNEAAIIEEKQVILPEKQPHQVKTLILDLDETLVHCVGEQGPGVTADVFLPITLHSGRIVMAGFNIRPYAVDCLRKANNHYEVIVFTASYKVYADVILDYLDPTGELIHHRVYRESCVESKSDPPVLIKDLRIFKTRQIKDLLIVDNCVYAFGFQLDNGVPIISFSDDKTDYELCNLSNYLDQIYKHNDLRMCNRKAFELRDISKINVECFIKYYQMDLPDEFNDPDYGEKLEEELQYIMDVRSKSFNMRRGQRSSDDVHNRPTQIQSSIILDKEQVHLQPKRMTMSNEEVLELDHTESAEIEFAVPLVKNKPKGKKKRKQIGFESQMQRECHKLGVFLDQMNQAKLIRASSDGC